MKTFLLATSLLLKSLIPFAQAGKPDLNFGTGGKIIAEFPPFNTNTGVSEFVSIDVQGDKFIVAGTSRDDISGLSAITMARYDKKGTIDSSFGIDGKVISSFKNEYIGIKTMQVQRDGKILTAGSSAIDGVSGFGMTRYNNNGSLDSSFGINGKVRKSFGNSYALLTCLALPDSNKILAVGNINNKGYLERYYENGHLDSTFVKGDISNASSFTATGVALQQDGKIVITGHFLEKINGDNQYLFGVLRYNPNGSIDSSFGNAGKVSTIVQNFALAYNILIQPDGKILVCGTSNETGHTTDFTLLRYNGSGTLDSSFGNNGIVLTDFDSGYDRANRIALQKDGKIILAGVSEKNSDEQGNFALARYNYNGSIDKSFENSGNTTTDFDSNFDEANAIIWTDSRFIVAGYSGRRAIVAAYQTDPAVLSDNSISFNASISNKDVILTWKAYLQPAISAFIIERSTDRTTFTQLGAVKPGATSTNESFSFKDDKPVDGRNFYRLKIVDVYGMAKYSNIETVAVEGGSNIVRIYPNPSGDLLTIITPSLLKNFLIQIIDITGKKVIEQRVKMPVSQIQLDIKKLAKGTYTMIIANEVMTDTKKFIKQ